MRRKISTNKYLMAAFITASIFLLGLLLGLVVEGKRAMYVNDMFDQQKVEFASSQIQYSYVRTLDTKDSCPAIFETFYDNLKQLDQTRLRLENYALASKLNDESFDIVKRQYTLEQIKYWLLAEQAQDICGEDLVRVLYFYSTDDECPDCANQAFVLNYLKGIFKEKLLIFALDSKFSEEPMIDILAKRFDVKEFPTIIIETETLEGYSSKKLLLQKICDQTHSNQCLKYLDSSDISNLSDGSGGADGGVGGGTGSGVGVGADGGADGGLGVGGLGVGAGGDGSGVGVDGGELGENNTNLNGENVTQNTAK